MEYLTYRGKTRRVIAIDPNAIVYPKKVTMFTDLAFIGWKKWRGKSYKEDPTVEYLPVELGRLIKYKIITREEHNTIINMLRSEDEENVYMAHRMLEELKNQRHKK